MRRRRILFFLLFFPAVTSVFYVYLGLSLCSNAREWLLLALPFIAVNLFPVSVSLRSRGSNLAATVLARAAYASMGFSSFLLVTTLARDVTGLVFHKWPEPRSAVLLAFAMLLVAAYSGFFGPRVKRLKLEFPRLPENLKGTKLVQVSDLHLSSHIGRRYAARVAKKIVALEPDLIALTGDIGDGHVDELGAEIETLRPLSRSAPVFYVPGNHEVYWNLHEWLETFRRLGMKVLLNEGETVRLKGEALYVGGITDPACEMKPDLAAVKGGQGAALRILLSHRPDPAEKAAEAGFDLQLSGHTHGGQFFPWTIVASLVHKYSLGLYRIGSMWVYVSAGTGSWGPRLRLGTRSEITLIELV